MPRIYADIGTNVRPYSLSRGVLTSIGRIVRACAELEDLINAYLERISGVEEVDLRILLGKMNVSGKLRLIDTYASARVKDRENSVYGEFLGDGKIVRRVFNVRNILSHGILLGKTDKNTIAFRTTNMVAFEKETLSEDVATFSEEQIREAAKTAEMLIGELERRLELQAWREERRLRFLHPHRKSHPKGKQTAKPSPQPPSSQG